MPLTSFRLVNFGPLTQISNQTLGPINLVLGRNSTGKTFLLKSLYSSVRTLEEYRRGDNSDTSSEILARKLRWTFQVERIGDLVTKGANGPLVSEITIGNHRFHYRFGRETTRSIALIENEVEPRSANSIFLPAKEVLSLFEVIFTSRERDKVFGFDDTYYDLVRALVQAPSKGRNHAEFAASRQTLSNLIGGKVELDARGRQWLFKRGSQKFPVDLTSEGIKKIGILDTLLGNRFLSPESIVFIDEPESALHPVAIFTLLDILGSLAKGGMQFFLASHSYFVVKKLVLLARALDMPIPVFSADENGWNCFDLRNGMPPNPIIDESVRLYEQEIQMVLE